MIASLDMVWSEYILNQFEWAALNGGATDESFYYLPYNSLLNTLFSIDEHFGVWPKARVPNYYDQLDFGVMFFVLKKGEPVFFLEVKNTDALKRNSSRETTDQQMRRSFSDFVNEIKIPFIHGISVFGTHLAFYTLEKETKKVTPIPFEKNPLKISDVAPINCWQDDVLQPNGKTKLLHMLKICAKSISNK